MVLLMGKMNDHSVTIKFGPVLGPLLENAARNTGRSRNAIVRDAVARHLQDQPARGTFGQIAGRFRGRIKGTPKDLASNPRYLRGFGG